MIREDIFGNFPQIAHTAYIDNTAILIGNIVVGENVYIGPNVVIRADEVDENYRVGKIVINDGASIYDGVNINTIGASKIEIGKNAIISNGAIIKGECYIGNCCNINIKTIIFNSYIGDNCYIGINAILENVKINDNMMVESGNILNEGNVALLVKPISKEKIDVIYKMSSANKILVNGYKLIGY